MTIGKGARGLEKEGLKKGERGGGFRGEMNAMTRWVRFWWGKRALQKNSWEKRKIGLKDMLQ